MEFVLENLAIGSASEAQSAPAEIEALLCVAEEHRISLPGYLSHNVPLRDMTPIPAPRILEAARWIDMHISSKRILVFCNAGVGRSPSVVIAYLCCFRRFDFGGAVEFVARRKPYVSTLPMLLRSVEETRRLLRLQGS